MAPTKPVLLADFKKKFKKVKRPEDKMVYIGLLCKLATLHQMSCNFNRDTISIIEIDEFFNKLLTQRSSLSDEEIIDESINYYNNSECPVRFGNIKHVANAVENKKLKDSKKEVQNMISFASK